MPRVAGEIFVRLLMALVLLGMASSCKREQRAFHVVPALAEMSEDVPANNRVRPGPPMAATTPSTLVPINIERASHEPFGDQYINNAQAMSDGQTLYGAFNCSGCHAHGGGGIGPPLLDNKWFYGSDPTKVYISIREGRPNGMPAYRGRIADFQIWELVAYVRSLSGQAGSSAASGREDHMNTTIPPNSTPREKPEKVPEPTTGPVGGQTLGITTTQRSMSGTEPATKPVKRPATTSQPGQNVQ